jgi:hypothetical protein
LPDTAWLKLIWAESTIYSRERIVFINRLVLRGITVDEVACTGWFKDTKKNLHIVNTH